MHTRLTRFVTLVLVLAAPLGGCKKLAASGSQCNFNADCEEGLVCAGNFCRPTCNPDAGNPDRDCPAGWRCRSSGPGGGNRPVCLPPGEQGYCAYHSDCIEPLVCVQGRCDSQCRTARDCQLFDPQAQCISIGDGLFGCSFRDAGVRDVPASFPNDAPATDASATDAAKTSDGG